MSDRGDRIESLIDAVIDGSCDEAGLRRLEGLVRDDPAVREAYLDQMRMHALLEWRHGRVEPRVERAAPSRLRIWPRRRLSRGLAAVALIGVGLTSLALLAARRGQGGDRIATLVEARDVVWAKGQSPIAVNARLRPQDIHCSSGTLTLALDSGARVTLEGPADLQILSSTRLRALRGQITTRIGGEGRGFTVETPNTLVVDQGTEFGVDVDDSGQTDVVVFHGLVDLSRPESGKNPAEIKHLGQGEALRVDKAGVLSRITAVERSPGDVGWSTGRSSDRDAVIRSVCDNIRGLDSSKYYQIVHRGLEDDAPAYVDRPHQWNGLDSSGLPFFLRGADYIMPFNEDKWATDLEITVEVARAATLYIFLDDREKPLSWLTGQFTNTGIKIGLDEGSWPDPSLFSVDVGPGKSINQVFSVWRRDVEADESIKLGCLEGGKTNRAMYGIAAVVRPRTDAPAAPANGPRSEPASRAGAGSTFSRPS
jgi:ferric-dicitrate binding protein FerR (iron transport regulator)